MQSGDPASCQKLMTSPARLRRITVYSHSLSSPWTPIIAEWQDFHKRKALQREGVVCSRGAQECSSVLDVELG